METQETSRKNNSQNQRSPNKQRNEKAFEAYYKSLYTQSDKADELKRFWPHKISISKDQNFFQIEKLSEISTEEIDQQVVMDSHQKGVSVWKSLCPPF